MAPRRHGRAVVLTVAPVVGVPRMTRGSARAIVCVLVAGTLAACSSGSSSPPATPTVTTATADSARAEPAATATASRAQSALLVPTAAREQSDAGAVAFVGFYLDQVNYAWMTPDATVLPPLAAPECSSCRGFQSDAAELVTEHQRMSPEPVRLDSARIQVAVADGKALVAATVSQTGAHVVDAAGAVADSDSPLTNEYLFALRWEGDQ